MPGKQGDHSGVYCLVLRSPVQDRDQQTGSRAQWETASMETVMTYKERVGELYVFSLE